MPVDGFNGRQILLHGKHVLCNSFGHLQLLSGAPLGVRGLDQYAPFGPMHWKQFGYLPYQPCKQQDCPGGQLRRVILINPPFDFLMPNELLKISNASLGLKKAPGISNVVRL
jgi:hypothetical protein